MTVDITVCSECGAAYDAETGSCPVCSIQSASEVRVVESDDSGSAGWSVGLDELGEREVDILLMLMVGVIAAWAALNVLGVL